MDGVLPVVLIVVAAIMVILALIALLVWRKQKEGKLGQSVVRNKKAFLIQLIIGIILAFTGAFFMFDGDILGEKTAGIATIIGFAGISLIATSNVTLWVSNANKN